jgi:membrane protease subunit HflK
MDQRHNPRDTFPLEDFKLPPGLEKFLEGLKQWGTGKLSWIILAIVLVIWLASGIYKVGPGERGVVRLFGKVVAQTGPGLRYRLPWPIQAHNVVDIARVRRAEIGFRTVTQGPTTVTQPVPVESLMLTGDENIVDIQLFVQYLVQDPVKYLFRSRNPERILRASAEVALRGVVGQNTIDYTMTEGRVIVQEKVKTYLQSLLDLYQTGLLVTEARMLVVDPPQAVRDAFHDVVRAWEDRARLIKEAEGYREDVLPKARGEAAEMIRQAEAYKEQRIIRAQGDAAKFLKVLKEYKKAKVVTRDRLYLEKIEKILPTMEKFILETGGEKGGGVLPLLPLRGLLAPTASQKKEGGDR